MNGPEPIEPHIQWALLCRQRNATPNGLPWAAWQPFYVKTLDPSHVAEWIVVTATAIERMADAEGIRLTSPTWEVAFAFIHEDGEQWPFPPKGYVYPDGFPEGAKSTFVVGGLI